MSRRPARLVVLAACVAAVFAAAADESQVVRGTLARILGNVAKIREADAAAVPMAFWDFDGTILKGDVSEGFEENGVVRYRGLGFRTVEAGLAAPYSGDGATARFEADYTRLMQIGKWLAWPYLAQMLQGREAAEVDAFCRREFDAVYRKWYFRSSVEMLRELERAGVENYVISASPEVFVRNAAPTLGLPEGRFRGVRVEIVNGRITPQVVHPIPNGEGKVENLRELVLNRPHGVAVAAFGNSYSTDGAFLRYVATQPSLPGGAKGTAVMINGGRAVPGYTEHFVCVDEDATVDGGDAPKPEARE